MADEPSWPGWGWTAYPVDVPTQYEAPRESASEYQGSSEFPGALHSTESIFPELHRVIREGGCFAGRTYRPPPESR